MRKQKNKAVWTLVELWIGIVVYFVFGEILGLVFVENRMPYTLGLAAGCVTAAFLAGHIFYTLDAALDMGEDDAVKHFRRNSTIRWFVIVTVVFAGMKLSYLSFATVIAGILSLKISAFFQPYMNLHMTKKLLRQKGW